MRIKQGFIHIIRFITNYWAIILSTVIITIIMIKSFYITGDLLHIGILNNSDFIAHTALIRSFSYGKNFPIEYPLFTGEPISYHFGFYLFVALLEKLGLRLDLALNIPSILGFLWMTVIIYKLTKKLTQSSLSANLAVLFNLGTFTLDWLKTIQFIKTNGLNKLTGLLKFNYLSVGPYDKGIISVFWNLGIYINQRHLSLSIALALTTIYVISFKNLKYWYNRLLILTVPILLFFINRAILVAIVFFYIIDFALDTLFYRKINYRKLVLYSFSAIILSIGYLGFKGKHLDILWHVGFLASKGQILKYVIYNFSILPTLLIASIFLFLKTPLAKKHKNPQTIKLAVIKLLVLIIELITLAFTVQFGIDIALNHKFITFSLIISFILISKLFQYFYESRNIIIYAGLFIFFALFWINTIVNLYPLISNPTVTYNIGQNSINAWLIKNTPKDAKILNMTFNTIPITLSGRRIFFGHPYFAMSAGYDTIGRRDEIQFAVKDGKKGICELMNKNDLSYIIFDINDNNFAEITIPQFYELFPGSSFKIIDDFAVSSYREICEDGTNN